MAKVIAYSGLSLIGNEKEIAEEMKHMTCVYLHSVVRNENEYGHNKAKSFPLESYMLACKGKHTSLIDGPN